MSTSQTGVQLRQRGLGIGLGGLVVQLIGVAMVSTYAAGTLAFIPLIAGALLVVLSYTRVKDSTGLANFAGAATLLFGLIATSAGSGGWTGFLFILIGVAVEVFGNKQLSAGIRS